MFRCCSGAEFLGQGKKNGIWPVLFVSSRSFGRTMWSAADKELFDYLCTPCLPQLDHSRKKGHRFHNP